MLYIFHVDTGTMMTFEMNLALESVGQLKDVIEETRRIPVDKQVLLVSGGECLDPCAKVCSYSAGTDTNPIFLFSKCTLENAKPPSPSIDYGSDSDMKDLVDNSLGMPATYSTVVKRAQIAQQFCELAREHTLVCENLVHDQHLQQQGWAAAVANLEDITAAFKTKSEMFEQNYKQYLETREENLKMLQNFSSDLQILAKIPILDPLLENALSLSTLEGRKKCEEAEQNKKNNEESEEGGKENSEELGSMTLLMWISTADNQSTLEQVAEQAQRSLEQLDESVLEVLLKDVESALETANRSEMKEIKGLEERLFGLEQLMVETKKKVQEQTDLAQALLQNQTRASSLNDPSVFPDLCASHRTQLLVMLQNQNMLRDIRRRCSRAKEELSINLYHRLSWVMYSENLILDVSNKLMIYHAELKRLRKYLEIIRQVQRTPEVYVAAVSEVIRRRTFSQAFLSWASDLSCRLLAIYNEEYEKRRDFQSQFEGHFLQSLFPGFEDNPPPFATQAPDPFDVSLPQLTVKDMEKLKTHLPELPMSLSVTKLSSIAQMFLSKSITEPKSLKVSRSGLGSQLDKTLLPPAEQEGEPRKSSSNKDERDLESETDTEEFEKVCHSPMEFKPIEPNFEENLESAKNEVDVLRFHLTEAGKLANETAIYLKTELVEMKSQSLTDKEVILALVKDIQICVLGLTQRYHEEVEALHKKLEEAVQSRDSEIHSLKKVVEEKEELVRVVSEDLRKIKNILEDTEKVKQVLTESLTTSQLRCEELKAQVEEAVQEKMKAVQSVTENFNTKIAEYEEQMNRAKEETEKMLAQEREKLTHDHNAQINELKSALIRTELDSEIEKEKLTAEFQQQLATELNEKLEDLRKKMKEEADVEREKAVKEVTETLNMSYKTEIESLRSRFRLMSAVNMEKSPSDSSLEKIERVDMIEMVNHEAIVGELKEMVELEKEKAVEEAAEAERKKFSLKLEEELKVARARMEQDRDMMVAEAVKKAVADKNNQIQELLILQESLVTECKKQEEKIRLLKELDHNKSESSPSESGADNPLLERINVLEKENKLLANELDRIKSGNVTDSKDVDMSTSVAVVPVTEVLNRGATTSPESTSHSDSCSRKKMSKSVVMSQQGKISVTSCGVGEVVLVVWNEEYANYTVLQETYILHFVHSDCLDSLGLRPSSDGSPRKLYCTAEVVEKEYCQAKKSKNRYQVPKGTKFYRLKVKPTTYSKNSMGKSCHRTSPRLSETSSSQKSVDPSKSSVTQSSETSVILSQLDQSSSSCEVKRNSDVE